MNTIDPAWITWTTLAWLGFLLPVIAGFGGSFIARKVLPRGDYSFVFGSVLFFAAYFSVKWSGQYLFPEIFSPVKVEVCSMQDSSAVQTLQIFGGAGIFLFSWFLASMLHKSQSTS